MASKKKDQNNRFGNPAKNNNPWAIKLFRTMRNSVELVDELSGTKITDKTFERLRVAALALMFVHAEMSNMPEPDVSLPIKVDEWIAMKDNTKPYFMVKPFTTTEGLVVICNNCYEEVNHRDMAKHAESCHNNH